MKANDLTLHKYITLNPHTSIRHALALLNATFGCFPLPSTPGRGNFLFFLRSLEKLLAGTTTVVQRSQARFSKKGR